MFARDFDRGCPWKMQTFQKGHLRGIVAPVKYPCGIGIFLVMYVTKDNSNPYKN